MWVTGASSGIGAGLARTLATCRCKLILSGRNSEALKEVSDQCFKAGAEDTLILPFDVTDFDNLESITLQAVNWQGQIDVLLNNAGISQRSLIIDTQLSTYRKIMDVDFFGHVALTKCVLPHMIKAGGGHIAVTSSIAGKLGSKLRSGYSSAKHALDGFFEALRAEHYDDGIRVSMLYPGYVHSNVAFNAITGDGGLHGKRESEHDQGITADEAGRKIIKQLGKEKEEIYVGSGSEMITPLLKRFVPSLLSWFLRKQKV